MASDGNQYSMPPSVYYLDMDCEPIAVRLYAENAPDVEDAEFNIYNDGTTIFADRASHTYYKTGGIETYASAVTNISLTKGENDEVLAGDFKDEVIEAGSWISCNLIKDGGGKNFTVQLDLREIYESGESEK